MVHGRAVGFTMCFQMKQACASAKACVCRAIWPACNGTIGANRQTGKQEPYMRSQGTGHVHHATFKRWASAFGVSVMLAACGGGSGSDKLPPSKSPAREQAFVIAPGDQVASDAHAARFLTQATYGATPASIKKLNALGYSNWLQEQFLTPSLDSHWDYVARKGPAGCTVCDSIYINAAMESFWLQALQGQDQLRQRTVLALSELFVVSTVNSSVSIQPDAHAAYLDMLAKNAFGNFRDLLESVTRHPTMAHYLSHLRNQKEDPITGRTPDENFAREVMQLFTIGLWQLDEKGRRLKDAKGQDIPTYDLADVMGMARVMTGLSWGGPDDKDARWYGWTGEPTAWNQPLQMYGKFHSQGEKNFLKVSIPARNGIATKAQADDDLKVALDTLFNHANTPAFIGKQLIKRFVTSNPSDNYVGRVAQAFRNNGFGVRGDMKAILRAVLMDPEARDASRISDPTWGKLREPMVRYANFLRAFGVVSPTNKYRIWNLEDPINSLGQNPLRAPSVFNWFQPEYSPAGELGDAQLTAPEMQITHETTLTGYNNFLDMTIQRTTERFRFGRVDAHVVDYAPWIALAAQPDKLLDQLDTVLMNGQLSADTRKDVLQAVNSITRNYLDITRDEARVHMAIRLLMASPEYIVQK
jgi:uncharacterized protein (DUF1800 family)